MKVDTVHLSVTGANEEDIVSKAIDALVGFLGHWDFDDDDITIVAHANTFDTSEMGTYPARLITHYTADVTYKARRRR